MRAVKCDFLKFVLLGVFWFMTSIIKETYHYKYLLQQLVVRDIKKKYRRSVLGVLWSVLNPLLMMAVTAMVFSTIFRFSIEN